MYARCDDCQTVFEVTGMNAFMVLTGGVDCPECGKEEGVCIVVAYVKHRKRM